MDNVKSFLNYLKVYKNYSELTIKNYYNDLTEFSVYVKKDLTRVKKEDIKSYLKYLFDKDNSNRTVSRKISTLKSFYKYLKENDVIRATRSAEKCYLDKNKEYKYKNDTLIELLEITEYEETKMSTIISKNEYKRRNNEYNKKKYQEKLKEEGKLSKKEEVNVRREKIKDLLAEGLSQKEIYSLLKISKRTCVNDVKFLKEQGLI